MTLSDGLKSEPVTYYLFDLGQVLGTLSPIFLLCTMETLSPLHRTWVSLSEIT